MEDLPSHMGNWVKEGGASGTVGGKIKTVI